jgi:hypothetical protein
MVRAMPAGSTTRSGTSSIWMHTGMRWDSRTQVKVGLTLARPLALGDRPLQCRLKPAYRKGCPWREEDAPI